MVESQPSKLLVAGSIPVSRSNLRPRRERWLASQPSACARRADERGLADLSAISRRAKADVAQLAERVLGKDEVSSSILDIGSRVTQAEKNAGQTRFRSLDNVDEDC